MLLDPFVLKVANFCLCPKTMDIKDASKCIEILDVRMSLGKIC